MPCERVRPSSVVPGRGAPGDARQRRDGDGQDRRGLRLLPQACRRGYRTPTGAPRASFDEPCFAGADGNYPRLLSRLARVDVLVIDDIAIVSVADTERRDLLEVPERTAHDRVCQPTAPERWHDYPRNAQCAASADLADADPFWTANSEPISIARNWLYRPMSGGCDRLGGWTSRPRGMS